MKPKTQYAAPKDYLDGFRKGNLYPIIDESQTSYLLEDMNHELHWKNKELFTVHEDIFNEDD